jgi:hypothetical protein
LDRLRLCRVRADAEDNQPEQPNVDLHWALAFPGFT